MKRTLFILSLILTFSSCGDDTSLSDSKGSIFVTVLHNWELVPDAQINTEPITSVVSTDLTGTAIISGVPIGGYKVNATHPNIGSGSSPITVTRDAIMDVTINLIDGIFEAPVISIQSPIDESNHNLGDEIQFEASVSDETDTPDELILEWSSNKDGILNTTSANASGLATFITSALSEGDHVITLTATDSDNFQTSNQISITVGNLAEGVTLSPINVSAAGLNLEWTVSTAENFSHYKILRSENANGAFQVIDIISNLNMTTYIDANVVFDIRYYYQISVELANGDESFSNIQSQVFQGENIDIGANIVRMIIDPSRPYIYALDQINNSMLFINKETKTIDKTIFVGSSPSDIDMNLDNSKAYIANFGSTQIAVIDLETQEKVNDLFVDTQAGTWDGNPYSLVWLDGNYLAFTSEDQWNNVKIVDADNGSLIAFTGSIHTPFLESNPAKNIVYGVDGGDVIRFNLNSDGTLNEVDETNTSSGSSRKVVVSRNGEFIFKGRNKILANNFSSLLGTFGESIYASNEDGSIVVGESNVWNGNNFSIISNLPIQSTLMEMDFDNETVYIYDNSTSKIFLVKI